MVYHRDSFGVFRFLLSNIPTSYKSEIHVSIQNIDKTTKIAIWDYLL